VHDWHADPDVGTWYPAWQVVRQTVCPLSEYVPVSHAVQTLFPVVLVYVPPAQDVQEHETAFAEYVPMPHGVHTDELDPERYPAVQFEHTDAPAAEYVPHRHVRHVSTDDVAPVSVPYLPARQFVQPLAAVRPVDALYVPSGHGGMLDEAVPTGQYEPAGQVEHAVTPAVEYVPAGH